MNSNKLAVITGGTKGIGYSIVKFFAEAGFEIVTCSRNQSELKSISKATSQNFSVTVHVFKADLSIKSEIFGFVDFIHNIKKPVEVLVNNTGRFLPGQIQSEAEGVFESMIATNLSSAYHLTQKLLPEMIIRQSGHIFNICSTASITAYTNGGSYCISKFALYGMSKVLREELKNTGIRVTSVLPGATLTASWDGVDLPKDRFIAPDDVASAVLNAYQMKKTTVVEELIIRPQLGDI